MKSALVFFLVVPLAGAIPTLLDAGGPVVLSLRKTTLQRPPAVRRRDVPPRQSLLDRSMGYVADLAIGTPPQKAALMVDTGSWTTWVNENPNCANAMIPEFCAGLPLYNHSASNPSPKRLSTMDQTAQYGGGIYVTMQGYTDTFTWGGATAVSDQPFAVIKSTNMQGLMAGLLGLAPDGGEGFDGGLSSYSVVATMAKRGIIKSRAFSLALGESKENDDHAGSLIFGGIDRNRFSGPLFKTPILSTTEGLDGWRYWVQVSEIRHNRPDSKQGYRSGNITGWNSKFLVDSGTTGVFLARELFDAILADMGLTNSQRLKPDGFPVVSCDKKLSNASIEFGFTQGSIKVPYSALLHQNRKDTSCYLAIGSAGSAAGDGDDWSILGLGFLKAAYAVFDWDNQKVHFGQGAACGDVDLVAIGSGAGAVPTSKGNCA